MPGALRTPTSSSQLPKTTRYSAGTQTVSNLEERYVWPWVSSLSLSLSLSYMYMHMYMFSLNKLTTFTAISSQVVYELPATSQWIFEVHWCPRNPAIISTSSFDGHISMYSLLGGGGGAQPTKEQQVECNMSMSCVCMGKILCTCTFSSYHPWTVHNITAVYMYM